MFGERRYREQRQEKNAHYLVVNVDTHLRLDLGGGEGVVENQLPDIDLDDLGIEEGCVRLEKRGREKKCGVNN